MARPANGASMRLRPSARLQKYLGRELIADPNLAVLEFVKNAYDAGASEAIVEFLLAEQPTTLTISDNGVGMDEDSFRENWLRPGYSSKSPEFQGTTTSVTRNRAAAARMRSREPAGEKGLGRLSSGRLGNRMQVWTRPTRRDPWLHVDFEWSRFEDMSLAMDDVAIPFDFETAPPVAHFDSGTVVQISGLRQTWTGRVPGRAQAGRKRTRLGRLKQDLEFLLRPLSPASQQFAIVLESDSITERDDVGRIEPSTARARTSDYRYQFAVGLDEADYVTIARTLYRSAEIAEELDLPRVQELPSVTVTREIARQDDRSEVLRCGPFVGEFLYTPPPAAKRATLVDVVSAGVLLYRDGVLVEPYGLPGDDWLGVEARKASRQGHAAIQPSTFSGLVAISRRNNPDLEDMSNRLGLLDNEASDDFFSHARAEFAHFESLIYEEVLRRRWTPKAERASKRAAREEELAAVRLRALAHRAGQPLQALGYETVRLEGLADREDLPPDVSEELRDVVHSVAREVGRLGGIVRKVADFQPPTFSEVAVGVLIQQVVSEAATLASARGVVLVADTSSTEAVIVPESLIFEALSEVVTNAIEAPRESDRTGRVTISVEKPSGTAVDINIADDGTGIANFQQGTELSSIPSTKARPAEGLTTAEVAATASRGAIRILASDADGTLVSLRLPTGITAVEFDK